MARLSSGPGLAPGLVAVLPWEVCSSSSSSSLSPSSSSPSLSSLSSPLTDFAAWHLVAVFFFFWAGSSPINFSFAAWACAVAA